MTMRNEEVLALEEKNFHPSSIHSSPSRRARVVNCVGSEPPWGSVMEYDEKISPSSSGRR
jgi:hypothetical protein